MRQKGVGWVVGVTVAFVFALDAPVAAGISTSVRNCPEREPGMLEVVSPTSSQVYSGPIVRIEIRVGCPGKFGAVPFILEIDETPYYPTELPYDRNQLFVPHNAQPNLPCCQTGGKGLLAYRLRIPPGDHVLTVNPGYQGTSLPKFDPVSVAFSVGSVLPMTGFLGTTLALGLITILGGAGLLLVAMRQQG